VSVVTYETLIELGTILGAAIAAGIGTWLKLKK